MACGRCSIYSKDNISVCFDIFTNHEGCLLSILAGARTGTLTVIFLGCKSWSFSEFSSLFDVISSANVGSNFPHRLWDPSMPYFTMGFGQYSVLKSI